MNQQHAAESRVGWDWLLLALLVAAAVCLPLSVQEIKLVPEPNRLLYVALWAVLAGVALARSAAPDWLGWLVGSILGIEYSVQFAGRLLPALSMVMRDLGYLVSWAWQLVTRQVVGQPWPMATSGGVLWERTVTLAQNLRVWALAVQAGEPSRDVTALWLFSALIIWFLTFNAAFELFRQRRTFVAMMPLGIAVVATVSFTYIGMRWVHIFLGITLLALVRANVKRMEVFWSRLGMDFSDELQRDATVAGTALAIVVLIAALLMPYLTYARTVFGFWDLIGPKVTGFYKNLDKAFAGRNPVPEPTRGFQGLGGHNVATGGLVGEDSVFIVTVSDPNPPSDTEIQVYESAGVDVEAMIPKRYWRERTYDVYTGHGWDTSARTSSDVRATSAWAESDFPYEVVTQTYRLLDEKATFGFAVNELVSVDKNYRVITRGAGDLAAFSLTEPEYTVVSHVPNPSAADLQAAEGAYPDWVAERFLELPEIPARVRDLAAEIVQTAGAETRYDKARALEAHIRNFAYDLEIEPPPLDADIVDYFLFDIQRGYCDYSATAMVVMLRSVGVAARYASGFGQGTFDETNAGWVVNEGNAHAWAEVYFPEYGWIEFEPTPIQRIFARGGASAGGALAGAAPATEDAAQGPAVPLWAWIVGLVAVVLFVIVWPPRFFAKRLTPRQMIWRTYDRVARWARWLGLAPLEGHTPREFLAWLAYHVEQRTNNSGAATSEITIISRLYLRARYAADELDIKDGWRAEAAWRALRPTLMRAILTREPSERRGRARSQA